MFPGKRHLLSFPSKMNVDIKNEDFEEKNIIEKDDSPDDGRMPFNNTDDLTEIYKKISTGYNESNFDLFFENFNLLVDISNDYYFAETEEFTIFSIEKIILNVISDIKMDDFIREQGLKLVTNLTATRESNFIKIFADAGLLPLLNSIIQNENEHELYDKVLSVFVNMSYNSPEIRELVYENVGIQTITEFIEKTPEESDSIGLATRLLYSLSKSCQESDFPFIIGAVSYLIHTSNKQTHIWGLWTAAMICNSEDVAAQIREIPDISEILLHFIDSDSPEIQEPTINLILQVQTNSEGLIEGFHYEKLVDFLKDEENFFGERVATIFANAMTSPELTGFFIDNGYIIFFVDAFHAANFKTQLMILQCFYNAIMTMPTASVGQFIEDGVIEILVQTLQFSDSEAHFHTLSCLITLLKIDGVKEQFLELIDKDSFAEIDDDDTERVEQLFDCLKELIPEFFE